MNRRGFFGFGAGAIASAPGIARSAAQDFVAPGLGSTEMLGRTPAAKPFDKFGMLDDLRKRLADMAKTEAERRAHHIRYALDSDIKPEPDIEATRFNWHTKRMMQARRYAEREMRREVSSMERDIMIWSKDD